MARSTKYHPDIYKSPKLKRMIDEGERERMRGFKDTSKPLHRFHDPDVSGQPVESRNADWAASYIVDHSYMGSEPLHHEIVHPSGKVERQVHQPGEWVGSNKFAFKN